MKKTIACGILMFLLSMPFVSGQSKQADIRLLIEVTGSDKIAMMIMDEMLSQFSVVFVDVPPEYWDRARQEFNAETLIDLVVPIYDKYYTHDEIRGLLDFYSTPLGQKVIEVSPVIAEESMTAGQRWGEELGQKLVLDLLQEGYIDSQ
jgi:uncharacterized protein